MVTLSPVSSTIKGQRGEKASVASVHHRLKRAIAMASAEKPFIRFTHSKALRKRTLDVLDAIDEVPDPTPLREDLSALLSELTEAGMQFFFLDNVKKLKMGFVVTQSSNIGVASVLRIMAPTVRNIVGRMDKKQMKQVSKIMRGLMK